MYQTYLSQISKVNGNSEVHNSVTTLYFNILSEFELNIKTEGFNI